jgi:hypothetical protein
MSLKKAIQELEAAPYLIVHIYDHALGKNKKIYKTIGNVGKLAGEPRISIPRSIVSTELSPDNASWTQLSDENTSIRHRRPHFDFSAKFSIEPSENGGVTLDEFFICWILDSSDIKHGLNVNILVLQPTETK